MKEERIRKNNEFRTVYRKGKSFSNQLLVLYILKNRKELNRVGISVSKKVGKSVVRSRVKRLISESYRINKEEIKKGYDFVFVARTAANDKNFSDIEKALKNLFKKAGLVVNEKIVDSDNQVL